MDMKPEDVSVNDLLLDGENPRLPENYKSKTQKALLATAAQFLVRDNKLNLIVFMRSNDVILGLGYDCFLFTMLQERMAQELGVQVGWYQHIAGSHLYRHHFNLAERILADPYKAAKTNSMPPMSDLDSISAFIAYEESVRLAPADDIPKPPTLPEYWYQLALVLLQYRLTKAPSGSRRAQLEEITYRIQTPYRELLSGSRATTATGADPRPSYAFVSRQSWQSDPVRFLVG